MATPEPDQIPITTYCGHRAFIKAAPIPRYYRLEYVSDSETPDAGARPEYEDAAGAKGDDDIDSTFDLSAVERFNKSVDAQSTTAMSEPRVRPSRHQGQLNFGNESMSISTRFLLFLCFCIFTFFLVSTAILARVFQVVSLCSSHF